MSLTLEERRAVVAFRIEKSLRAYEQAKGVVNHNIEKVVALAKDKLR